MPGITGAQGPQGAQGAQGSIVSPTPFRTITADYSVANGDYTIFCDNTAGISPIIVTLPSAAANAGRVYVIKRVSTAGGTANNASCFVSPVDGSSGNERLTPPAGTSAGSPSGIIVQSDGTAWWITGIAP